MDAHTLIVWIVAVWALVTAAGIAQIANGARIDKAHRPND